MRKVRYRSVAGVVVGRKTGALRTATMTGCFMLAVTVDDSYDRLVIFLGIGAKMELLAFRRAEGSGSILGVFILSF